MLAGVGCGLIPTLDEADAFLPPMTGFHPTMPAGRGRSASRRPGPPPSPAPLARIAPSRWLSPAQLPASRRAFSSRRIRPPMTDKSLDVLAIGNAIVDVIADADDAFLAAQKLDKGSMRLIDEAEAVRLYGEMAPGRESSGGSAGNTVAGLAALGLKAGFIGQVADDELGRIFAHDLRATGVELHDADPRRRRRQRALPDPRHARCPADDEHLPRRGAAIAVFGNLGDRSRVGEDPLPRRLSVGSGGAARGDGGGDRRGAGRGHEGRLHPVRQLLHRPPSRRLRPPHRCRADRHLVRQRGGNPGAGRRGDSSTRRWPRLRRACRYSS